MVQPTVETRSPASRLDHHDEQISQLQADVTLMQSKMDREQMEMGEFRTYVMNWIKKQDKVAEPSTGGSSGGSSGMGSDSPFPQSSGVLNSGFGGGSLPPPGGSGTPSGGLPWAVKKVKLPEFYGFDPQGWIQKANLFFDINGTDPSLRIRLAQLSMTGVAQHWFSVVRQVHDSLTWEQFQEELLQRFSGLEIQNPYEQLALIQQSTSIHDYIDDFEYLMSLVPKMPEMQAMGYFVAGLHDDVRRWVRLQRPQSRLDAMYSAKDVEEILRPGTGTIPQTRFRYHSAFGSGSDFGSDMKSISGSRVDPKGFSNPKTIERWSPQRLDGPRSSLPPRSPGPSSHDHPSTPPRDRGVRSLTRTEWEERRKKGLCFRCGQQFGPGHKCPDGKLRVLILGDDEVDEGSNYRYTETPPLEDSPLLPNDEGHCAALEFTGTSTECSGGKTLKFDGELLGIPVVVLVDSGATHNFLSRQLVLALGISSIPFHGINIKLGDGHVVRVTEKCVNLHILMGGCSFAVNLLVFDTGNPDIILGMEWLKTLGEVTHNWDKSWMRFSYQGMMVQLQGLIPGQPSQASLHKWLQVQSSSSISPSVTRETSSGLVYSMAETGLSLVQQDELQVLFCKFDGVFQPPRGLPLSRPHDHIIALENLQAPVCVRPYRYPHVQKSEIERQVQELLNLGLIRPSKSAYSSPVILVRKKDNTWRMCVDYRALNKATIPDKFPIPVVEELLDELFGACYFSKLDLKSGYNQIRMHEDSVEKTAFRTHDGHYEYLVMPFGLMNAPATFQAVMNDVFRPLLRKKVVIFFDDILVYSATWQDHLHDLATVLRILEYNQFVVNQKKCSFGQQSIEYLGHIIDGKGVSMDPTKVDAVVEWPVPKQLKGLRGFLGLTGYYRKFVRNYGSIARPLTDLTKKDAFKWNSEAQMAFDNLKNALVTAPVLALPDFSVPFVVECDASGRGIGAVLMQRNKPIAYFSRALSDQNLSKSAYEREIMALVLAVQHWRSYLLGTKFVVYTDQKSLKFLLQQRITSPDQQNWVAKLLGYDFDIQYKPGRENRAADALSRRAEAGELHQLQSAPVWVQGAQLVKEAQEDRDIQRIMQACQDSSTRHPGFSVRNGILYYRDRLVIPRQSKFIPALLHEFHVSATGGHSGYYRTYRRLAANLYWPGMIECIKNFVRACDVCQRCKASSLAPGGLLQPLDIPKAIWEDLSLDFILGLPKSKGFDAVLVVVDRLSKYAHFILLKHPYTARTVAEVFVREVVRHHGIPKSIVSDRDPLFISKFWQEIFKAQGTQLHMSSAYHPESDGQTEVINRCLEAYLRCFAVDQPRLWTTWIPWAEFWYNSTFHGSTGISPFEVVYGRKPPTVFQYVPGEVRVQAVSQELQDRDEALRQLKVHLAQAQSTMKAQADKKRRDSHFQNGEWVYVKLKPYRQKSVSSRIHHKLAAKFFGPFQILEKIGPVAYKLQLPPTSKVHPVFHVSLLKKAVQVPADTSLPPELEVDTEDMVIPAAVLATRSVGGPHDKVEQWLVHWQGQSLEEATWEDAITIKEQFPNTSLEVKTLIEGGSNDTDTSLIPNKMSTRGPLMVYSRRDRRANPESG
uniref:Reverse transcriptase n=1 Tax=Lactuca sativa TaxID=4236 RepID=A0A9R1UUI4_LACSA|nr:hypothetical protein LSAT_V11C800408980 [Lactuca sativa]